MGDKRKNEMLEMEAKKHLNLFQAGKTLILSEDTDPFPVWPIKRNWSLQQTVEIFLTSGKKMVSDTFLGEMQMLHQVRNTGYVSELIADTRN